MDVEYKGQHSIIFFKDTGKGYSKRNSWIDFHMIPATRPYVALGTPNIAQVAIPGTSKRVDITDYRPGGLTFGGRTGTWEFYIDHNKWSEWDSAYNTIKYYIHGNSFLINLTDDPYILYQGILNISGYVAGQNYSKITIQYDLMNDTITLDEPIDFGDFGRLPDPKLLDSDGDGILDSLDLDGDGKKDVDLAKSIGYDTDCDRKSDVWVALDPAKRPKRKLIYGKGSGIIEGLDVNGDYVSDFYAFTDPTGKYGFDFNCDGFVDEDVSDQEYISPTDINIPEDKLPPGAKPKDEWTWISGDPGDPPCLDVTGDGVCDYIIGHVDQENPTLVDPLDPTTPVTDTPLPEPPKAPDPDNYDIPQKEDRGYDTDCDEGHTVDIAIDQLNPIPPVYIYDEDTGYLIGADCNFDGKVDIYATTDENGNQGIDFNCDGKWDTPVYTPPDKRNDEDKNIPEPGQEDPEGDEGDPTSVIGAYYPLLFIQSDGIESNMYGFSTVSKSNKILGVYDLYTIYQSDKVTPETLGIG